MQLSRSILAASLIGVIGASAFGLSRHNAFAANIAPGDLIRGQTYSAVYYMGKDGFRYVFPNFKTYTTWYADFNNVKFITDAELATIQIGGNVTYKPGVRMIKIDSDPKTYAVDAGGTLRHVIGESTAVALYGANWNKMIDDLPDGFFSNYKIGADISSGASFIPAAATAAATDINFDKGLIAPATFSITDTGYNPIDIHIVVGQNVKFTNIGSVKHTATGDDLTWGSGTLNPGESFIKKFTKAGTYTFFDSYNSAITGAIYVQ